MKHISYGIIPIFKTESGSKEYLILKNHGGFWSFPKGHPEKHETPEATAIRELYEETGLTIDISSLRSSVHYEYKQPIEGTMQTKRIVLSPALVSSKGIVIQPEEIADYKWTSFDDVISSINLPGILEPLSLAGGSVD